MLYRNHRNLNYDLEFMLWPNIIGILNKKRREKKLHRRGSCGKKGWNRDIKYLWPSCSFVRMLMCVSVANISNKIVINLLFWCCCCCFYRFCQFCCFFLLFFFISEITIEMFKKKWPHKNLRYCLATTLSQSMATKHAHSHECV